MLSEGAIIINKVAQGKLAIEDGLQWFKEFDPTERRGILTWLRLYLEQAHPEQKLVDQSIEKIALKPTITPVVLFRTHPYKIAAAKVCDLPDDELENSFLTLLTLFKFADIHRRQTICKHGCDHEWHNLDRESNQFDNRFSTRIIQLFRRLK